MIKIPLWIDILAYVRPFRFCARCMKKQSFKGGTYFKMVKHWALKRCMVCGKKLGGESNES